jgi:hypothetical protein
MHAHASCNSAIFDNRVALEPILVRGSRQELQEGGRVQRPVWFARSSRLRGPGCQQVVGRVSARSVKAGSERSREDHEAVATRQRCDQATRPWRRATPRRDRAPAFGSAATDSRGEQTPGGAEAPRKRGAWKRQEGRKPATADDSCEGKPLKAPQNPKGVTGAIRRA